MMMIILKIMQKINSVVTFLVILFWHFIMVIGDDKTKQKVQIPLLIVIPPMGSSTPRLVWSAGRFVKVSKQLNLYVILMIYMKILSIFGHT